MRYFAEIEWVKSGGGGVRFMAILFSLLFFSATSATVEAQTAKAVKKQLTLNEVLGCAQDEWMVAAWKASFHDMLHQGSVNKDEISAFPFVTGIFEENSFFLISKNATTDDKNFCHSNVNVRYKNVGDTSTMTLRDFMAKPVSITILVDEQHWVFDFSQVLRHADQFKWESGVFEDLPNSYLEATKGHCTLQFLISSTGVAKLYRVWFEAAPLT